MSLTANRRAEIFGTFEYELAPRKSDPEAIKILGGWAAENIVKIHVPQVAGIPGAPKSCNLWVHRKVADQFKALFFVWEEAGVLDQVLSYNGLWVPRLVRGGKALSNHSFGTAMDLNAKWNPLGKPSPSAGEKGSLVELAAIAEKHGFFWGNNYQNRKDPMHIEASEDLVYSL
jgi:hypothetical protein